MEIFTSQGLLLSTNVDYVSIFIFICHYKNVHIFDVCEQAYKSFFWQYYININRNEECIQKLVFLDFFYYKKDILFWAIITLFFLI